MGIFSRHKKEKGRHYKSENAQSTILTQSTTRERTHTWSLEMLPASLCLLEKGLNPTQSTNSSGSPRMASQVSQTPITHHSES